MATAVVKIDAICNCLAGIYRLNNMAGFITFLILIVVVLLFIAGNIGVIGFFASDSDSGGDETKGCLVVIGILIIVALMLYALRECVS